MSDRTAILWPMCAQAGLVALVWLRLYAVRLTEIRTRRIDPQQLARADEAVKLLANNSAADNLRNLFEIPVLFFAICLALYVTGFVTPIQVSLAWGFMMLRGVHSFVHTTYNRVMHRFLAYAVSTVLVFAMWALFTMDLLDRTPEATSRRERARSTVLATAPRPRSARHRSGPPRRVGESHRRVQASDPGSSCDRCGPRSE